MATLYKNLIPVVFNDLNEGFLRGAPSTPPSFGAVPRDYSIDPVEMRDSPGGMQLIDPSEYDAQYKAGEENEDSLEHLYLRAVAAGKFEFLDQNGYPDCWAHSTAHAIMIDALKQNVFGTDGKVKRLNAVAVATLLRQTNGGWCGLSMKFARDNGYPEVGTGVGQWPYQSRNGHDTPELRANMKTHRDLEDWYDLGKQVYDQTLTKAQLATCLFNNLPCPSDYNRFGHSMLSLRWIPEFNGPLTLNSWAGFGYHGLCVLANMVPDGACALRSSTPNS